MHQKNIFAVIMAGGKGERLWPISTDERPKPLIAVQGTQTLLEETVQRLFPLLDPEHILVIADEKSSVRMREILLIPPENIIAEPCRRNTAPCIALAAAVIRQKCRNDEDPVMIVLPADHHISPVKRFQEDLADCIRQAQKGDLTILGIAPDKPATEYGYIKVGQEIGSDIYKVEQFKEKPNLETAQQYMASGKYWWNGGIFIWKISSIAAAFQKYCPLLYEKWKAWAGGSDYREDFDKCQSISIDYAVIEKADNIVVKKASFNWNDLGTLRTLYEIIGKDEHGNAINVQGKVQLEETEQNFIFCDDDTEIRLVNMKKCAVVKSGKFLLLTGKW